MTAPDEPILARRLRGLGRVIAIIAVVLSGFAFLPAERVYRDAHHCAQLSIGATAPACVASYTEQVAALDNGGIVTMLWLIVATLPVLLVLRAPRSRAAGWVWLACFAVVLPGIFDRLARLTAGYLDHVHTQIIKSWTGVVFAAGTFGFVAITIVGLLTILVFTPKPSAPAPPPPAPLPVARVV